jgi:hypothetical protein
MARPSHPPRLDYSNYTWRRVQIMNCDIFSNDLFAQSHPTSVINIMMQTIQQDLFSLSVTLPILTPLLRLRLARSQSAVV